MKLKIALINALIKKEGGHVNDPDDSGGETNYGVTLKAAREYGYGGAMSKMPLSLAIDIYSDTYWHSIKGDAMAEISPLATEEVFDASVNLGPAQAGTFLQRCLNVLNDRQRLYDDMVVDGMIGAKTLSALKSYIDQRDEKVVLSALNSLQCAFYIELAERRSKDEKFIYGWIKNRVSHD